MWEPWEPHRKEMAHRPKATASHTSHDDPVATIVFHRYRRSSPATTTLYAQSATAPRTIACPSTLACWTPFVRKASARDASATDGAAPKMPAKLFGCSMSPITAKAETMRPPSTKRMASSESMADLVHLTTPVLTGA